MLGFLMVPAVLAIFCSVCASYRSRLVTLSMCLCIWCTSFRYSSYLLNCLVRVRGHALIVVLARVPSQLVCDGVASPVVFGNLTVILILLRLMSWDPFYVHGFSNPRNDSFLPKTCHRSPSGLLIYRVGLVAPVLDSSEAFDNRLVVNSNRDGSRSVRSDDGGGKLHARGVVDGGTHGLLPVRHNCPSISMLCSG